MKNKLFKINYVCILLSSLVFLCGSVFAAEANSEDPFIGTWYTTGANNTLKITHQDLPAPFQEYNYKVDISVTSFSTTESCKIASPTQLTCMQITPKASTLKLNPAASTIEYDSFNSEKPIIFSLQPQEDPLKYLFHTFKMVWSNDSYDTIAFQRYNSNTLIVKTNDARGNYGQEPLEYKVIKINDDRDKILLGHRSLEGRDIKHSVYYEKSTKKLYMTSDSIFIICSENRPCIYEQVD